MHAIAVLALVLSLTGCYYSHHHSGHWHGHTPRGHHHQVERHHHDRHHERRTERPEVTEDNWRELLDTSEWRLKGPRYQQRR
jgi:hypothetical protein